MKTLAAPGNVNLSPATAHTLPLCNFFMSAITGAQLHLI